MIILLTVEQDRAWALCAGDTFRLAIDQRGGEQEIIQEIITKTGSINYVATFCFAGDDGTVLGTNICGIFADKDHLPQEMLEAVKMDDLSPEQKANFLRTTNIKVRFD